MESVKTVKNNKKKVAVNNALPSFIAGGLMGITALGCPCPACIGLAGFFIANGIRETIEKAGPIR